MNCALQVRDLAGLQALVMGTTEAPLRLPLLLQQYIQHGPVLTKVGGPPRRGPAQVWS